VIVAFPPVVGMTLTCETDNIGAPGHKPAFVRNLGVVSVAKNFDEVKRYLTSKLIKHDCPFTVVTIKPAFSSRLGGQGNEENRRVTLSNPFAFA